MRRNYLAIGQKLPFTFDYKIATQITELRRVTTLP